MTTQYLVVSADMLVDVNATAFGDCNVYAASTTLDGAQECVKELVENGSAELNELIIIPFSKYYEAKPVDPEWVIKTVK